MAEETPQQVAATQYVYGWGRTKHIRDTRTQYERGLCGAYGGNHHPGLDKRPICKTCLKIAPPAKHRILWNAGRVVVDEIVVEGCMAHLEELSDGRWYLALYPADQPNERVMLNISGSITVSEEIAWSEDEEHGRG